jgi:hypothetical protein
MEHFVRNMDALSFLLLGKQQMSYNKNRQVGKRRISSESIFKYRNEGYTPCGQTKSLQS